MGAWIETFVVITLERLTSTSHPTWVRGLKLARHYSIRLSAESHPTWVRGLKPGMVNLACPVYPVAPHVGAWIETGRISGDLRPPSVAPHVGAWIETTISPAEATVAERRTPRGCVD